MEVTMLKNIHRPQKFIKEEAIRLSKGAFLTIHRIEHRMEVFVCETKCLFYELLQSVRF